MAFARIDGWTTSYHEYKQLTRAEKDMRSFVIRYWSPFSMVLNDLIEVVEKEIKNYPPGTFEVKKHMCGQIIGKPETATYCMYIRYKNKREIIRISEPHDLRSQKDYD